MDARKKQHESQHAAGGQKEQVAAGGTGVSAEGAAHGVVATGTEARSTFGAGRWRRRGRVLVGGAACVVIAAGLLVLSGTLRLGREEGVAKAAKQTQWACPPPPQPGFPRSWEAGIQVSTYGIANAVNRNLLTIIPITGWSGLGPGMYMALYHNSGATGSPLPLIDGMGFDLGPGWRTAFSGQIIGAEEAVLDYPPSGGSQVIVVSDDGRQDTYTYAAGLQRWLPPAGVFSELSWDGSAFTLRHKDQSYHRFAHNGQLASVGDAIGNEIWIERSGLFDTGRIVRIFDAAGRHLEFKYDLDGRLWRIEDPGSSIGPPRTHSPPRIWELFYFNETQASHPDYPLYGMLKSVVDPMNNEIVIRYSNSEGRISEIADQRKSSSAEPVNLWAMNYQGKALWEVVDPTSGGGAPGMFQRFSTTCTGPSEANVTTSYQDRRGSIWLYGSVRENPTGSPSSGPLSFVENPLGQRQTVVFEDRLLAEYRDALGRGWDFAYDNRGNRLSAIDPLNPGRHHQWTYDWNPVTSTGYHNVKTYTDPAGNVSQFVYDYEIEVDGYPGLLRRIVAPPDGQGLPQAETLLDYYIEYVCLLGSPCRHGKLKRMTDPNGVVTAFDYDQWGQLAKYSEGIDPNNGNTVMEHLYTWTARLNMVQSAKTGCPAGTGESTYNLLGLRLTGTCGIPVLAEGGSDAPCMGPPPPSWLFPGLSCVSVSLPVVSAELLDVTYDGFDRATGISTRVYEAQAFDRTITNGFDELNRSTFRSVVSQETGGPLVRDFNYGYAIESGQFTRWGPDGIPTLVESDAAGRPQRVQRGPAGAPLMDMEIAYYPNGLVAQLAYDGGLAYAHYEYDSANRVTVMEHQIVQGAQYVTVLRQTFEYDERDLAVAITETGSFGSPATIAIQYDDRGRVIRETRTGSYLFDLSYEYDQGGNRTLKVDHIGQRLVEYHYDVNVPPGGLSYGSANNRLMYYDTFDTSAQPPSLMFTTWYFYNGVGNVTHVVDDHLGLGVYTATRFEYARNGEAVVYTLAETWHDADPGYPVCQQGYQPGLGREFRYDELGRRYMTRPFGPDPGLPEWSDYDGDGVYGDYIVESGLVERVSHEPGLGKTQYLQGAAVTSYYVTDMQGSIRARFETGPPGDIVSTTAYTTFGERVSGVAERYGYWGSSGAETFPELPFILVGGRFYDPATGRFLQRGVATAFGANPYVPGAGFWDGNNWFHEWVAREFWMAPVNPASGRLDKMNDVEAAAWAGGYSIAGGFGIYSGGLRPFSRWMNRGYWRIGPSGPFNGRYYFSFRKGNVHTDLFCIPKWLFKELF